MSDNLEERLHDLSVGTGSKTPLAALDRIEELEAKLAKAETATMSHQLIKRQAIEIVARHKRYWEDAIAEIDSIPDPTHAEKLQQALSLPEIKALVDALDETRIVLAEHEPHPLPVLAKVLATLAAVGVKP